MGREVRRRLRIRRADLLLELTDPYLVCVSDWKIWSLSYMDVKRSLVYPCME